ncbi:MAG: hypothetical protein BWY55_00479 [archaeon ADurb.Bin336]|nr:MAG: hypothetical protein BWY55_00479 [archaeon ADurb.Bin336]
MLINHVSTWLLNHSTTRSKSISSKSSMCTRKLIPIRPLKNNCRYPKNSENNSLSGLHIIQHILESFFFSCKSTMSFNPKKFSTPQKRSSCFGFIPKNISALISSKRQIFVRAKPQSKHSVKSGFTSWA